MLDKYYKLNKPILNVLIVNLHSLTKKVSNTLIHES